MQCSNGQNGLVVQLSNGKDKKISQRSYGHCWHLNASACGNFSLIFQLSLHSNVAHWRSNPKACDPFFLLFQVSMRWNAAQRCSNHKLPILPFGVQTLIPFAFMAFEC